MVGYITAMFSTSPSVRQNFLRGKSLYRFQRYSPKTNHSFFSVEENETQEVVRHGRCPTKPNLTTSEIVDQCPFRALSVSNTFLRVPGERVLFSFEIFGQARKLKLSKAFWTFSSSVDDLKSCGSWFISRYRIKREEKNVPDRNTKCNVFKRNDYP